MVNNTAYFREQLKKSEECEKLFAAWLESRNWEITSLGEKAKGFDIKAVKDNLELSFEIKFNSQINKYKTAFVETFQSGYPSGLQVTTADYQIHFNEDLECRCMKTSDLRKYISKHNIPLSATKMMTKSGKVSGNGFRVPFKDMVKLF